MTQPFCGDCTRARLSAEGVLYTCLFTASGTDLRAPLRAGASDQELTAVMSRTWGAREDRYSELRSVATSEPRSGATSELPRVEMSYIGG